MRLWNTSSKKIETGCGGVIFEFAPNEQKTIHAPDVYNHLYFKLKSKGLVLYDPETLNEEQKKKLLIDGLKSRWKMLDAVVRNFRTMNKDRESHKLAAEAPSEAVQDAAEEAGQLLAKLKTLEKEKFEKVESYLNDERTNEMTEMIAETEGSVETSGAFGTKVSTNKKNKGKNAPASA